MRFVNGRIVLVTVMCERCGIDVLSAGLCVDCMDVLGITVSNRSTFLQRGQAEGWLAMGIPVKEVAENLGYHHTTILHWVSDYGWERFFWADAKGIGNRVKARFH